MAFNRPRVGSSIFSGRAPQTPLPNLEDAQRTAPANQQAPINPRQANLVNLAEIQPCPADWLWQDRLAAGTLALLSGAPGVGKTYLSLAIAADLTRGSAPFTGASLEPVTVLYIATEGTASAILRPRFESLGGDLSRLFLLREGDAASTRSLRDTPALENALQRTRARLLIIDPLKTHIGADDVESLARLAENHHCCILFISNRQKRANAGSVELSSAARTEFLAASSPDAPLSPALVHLKSNLGPLAPPLAYKIDPAGNFSWTGLSQLTPSELIAGRPTGAGTPQRRFASDWLSRQLQTGALSQYKIETAAQHDGISIATLRRAKLDIGVTSIKDGINGPWCWSLPSPAL